MIKIFIICAMLLAGIQHVYAQAAPHEKTYPLPFGHQVKAIDTRIQGKDFFIIHANTNISVNTGASAVINAYTDIRKLNPAIPVYFCIDNDAQVDDITWYFRQVYKIPVGEDPYLTVIVDNKELNGYIKSGGSLSKIYFVKDNQLIYLKDAKYFLLQIPACLYIPMISGTHWCIR